MSLVKSKERVKNFGEVFTPSHIVEAMLDLVEPMTIEKTFLEPSCGNGNFVIGILKRKFDMCKTDKDFKKALSSVVGIDLLADNVAECKQRIKELYKSYGQTDNIDLILDNQIFQGDSLKVMGSMHNAS